MSSLRLGRKQRQRLSGMLANFAQVAVGALLVSTFFKEANWVVRLFAVIFISTLAIGSVLIEPEENQ